jgi:hypothetical protein
MKVAGELPTEKRHESFLTINGALRMLTEPEHPQPIHPKPAESTIDFLPALGEMAIFIDDDWEYFLTQSSQHPGYYWLQRWFNDAAGHSEFNTLYRHDEPMDSEYNMALMKRFENRLIPCNIFRRPINAHGVSITLRKWKVNDEQWTLLGPLECDASVNEAIGLAEWERHKRETWPRHNKRLEAQS